MRQQMQENGRRERGSCQESNGYAVRQQRRIATLNPISLLLL
jgi:hypothetical protein